jgi:tetratricopeptide (TPR) repeat protein
MAKDYADVLNGTFGEEKTVPVAALSYIFGGGIRLLDDSESHEERRIVIYPCATDDTDMTELAQGLMCVLAWELNALDGVTAIPLLTRNATSEWRALDSAFTPENFTLEGLGEDTLLTATLVRNAVDFKMSFRATTDIEDIEDLVVDLQATSKDELLGTVLKATNRISEWLRGDMIEASGVGQVKTTFAASSEWLIAAFAWHRAALADAASGKAMDLTTSAFRHLTSAAIEPVLNSLITKGVALSMMWFEQFDAMTLLATLSTLPGWQGGAGAVSQVLIEQGKTREAIEFIDSAVDAAPEIALNWLVLARLYGAVQRPDLAIETLQAAIERHRDYAPLLIQYGDVLMSYVDQNIPLEEVIFIDEGLEPASAFEAIAAYEEAIHLLQGEQQFMAYVPLITALARYQPDKLWTAFDALAILDTNGVYTELALNSVAAQAEMDKAVSSLYRAAQSNPNSSRVWRNLAYAQYLARNEAGAATAIEEALKRATDARSRGEYELLSIYAQDSTVEAELAEIADNLSVGGEVSDRTLELLEWIVTEAPHYIEGYLLLGRAYDANDESATALEVLLDAEKRLGADADIYVAIIDLLLEADEETVALDYVSKALDAFPRHIPLLARAALVTDALGDREGAKAFLRQAHNIVPFHREIMRVTGIFRDSEDGQ